MSRDDDPAVLEWLKSQATKGAMIIGVCAGAKVVGEAGLLNGKRATTGATPAGSRWRGNSARHTPSASEARRRWSVSVSSPTASALTPCSSAWAWSSQH